MYIAFDCETGGIGLDKSLLDLYLCILDNDFNQIDELQLWLKPDDGIYHASGEALRINKINLAEHDLKAFTYREAKTRLFNFICRDYITGDKILGWSNITDKCIPIGHNIAFDLTHVWDKLITRATWENYISYRCLDTCSISQFCRIQGKLPKDIKCSLGSLAKYFSLSQDNLHTSKADTLMTIEVLKRLMEL